MTYIIMDKFSIWPMIIITFAAGFLTTMNIVVSDISQTQFQLNDIYSIALTTAWMAFLFSIFYYNHIKNSNIVIIISLLFIILLYYLIRNQIFIDDNQFLKSMIERDGYGILLAEKIKDKTHNKQITQLANNVINNQSAEIKTMENILESK